MNEKVSIHAVETLAEGWGTLRSYDITHPKTNGGSQRVKREVYDHGNAAAVLLVDPRSACVVLVRQFRLPPHLNGDNPSFVEACAGLLDGDLPEDCARREAEEETGYAPTHLEHLFDIYFSPGSLSEKCSCFIGCITQGEKHSAGGGVADESEDIEILEMTLEDATNMVAAGEILDGKTILMLQWLALNPGWMERQQASLDT
ncbi:ADP-ribose pyrophosphatase [Devosia pacifica]|uniref:GDP-mannose pyrophosphatase n=1 Tax=Devosia pacifica TaxID=1335967 RepID=A0A918VU88_9HYPH|nr:NUDIX domain-containing protein [Devosia pacifica]GHA24562.1 ADP-ribose pyrophosphatase [Devosia pacifica]